MNDDQTLVQLWMEAAIKPSISPQPKPTITSEPDPDAYQEDETGSCEEDAEQISRITTFLKQKGDKPAASKSKKIMTFESFFYSMVGESVEKQTARLRQLQLNDNQINDILAADPTTDKKYALWIAKLVKAKNVIVPEDNSKILPRLDKFNRIKGSPTFTGKKDIFQYVSLQQLIADLDAYESKNYSDITASKKETIKQTGNLQDMKGLKKVNESGIYELWEISDGSVANKILQKSNVCEGEWCVKDPKYWEQYTKQDGKMYLVTKENNFYVLFDFSTMSAKDPMDANISYDIAKEINVVTKDLVLQKVKEKFGDIF